VSSCNKVEMICPKCRAPQLFDDWMVVNVTLNPELKERVLNGDLLTFKCSLCRHEAPLHKPLLYSDSKKNFMVHLLHGEQPDSDITGSFPQMHKVRLRYVDTEMQFYDKIRIFDDGLDDRIIEIEKLALFEYMHESWQVTPVDIFYQGISDDVQGGEQMGYYVVLEDGMKNIAFPYPEKYEKSVKQYAAKLPDTSCELGRWLKVDRECAKGWLAAMNLEKIRPSASTIERVDSSAQRRPSASSITRVAPSGRRRPSASGITRATSGSRRRRRRSRRSRR